MDNTDRITREVSVGWDAPQLVVLTNSGFTSGEIAMLKDLLTPEERSRSERFRFTQDRKSFILVHGMLRHILGVYFNISPVSVGIIYNAFGKPSMAGNTRNLHFNLSHSGDVSVLAFDPNHEIGVDVEEIREDFEYRPIMDAFFSDEDNRFLSSTEGDSARGFYKTWTRKEALLKAIGTGLGENLGIGVSAPLCSGFVLNTMMFGERYFITTATGPLAGGIKTILT